MHVLAERLHGKDFPTNTFTCVQNHGAAARLGSRTVDDSLALRRQGRLDVPPRGLPWLDANVS